MVISIEKLIGILTFICIAALGYIWDLDRDVVKLQMDVNFIKVQLKNK